MLEKVRKRLGCCVAQIMVADCGKYGDPGIVKWLRFFLVDLPIIGMIPGEDDVSCHNQQFGLFPGDAVHQGLPDLWIRIATVTRSGETNVSVDNEIQSARIPGRKGYRCG